MTLLKNMARLALLLTVVFMAMVSGNPQYSGGNRRSSASSDRVNVGSLHISSSRDKPKGGSGQTRVHEDSGFLSSVNSFAQAGGFGTSSGSSAHGFGSSGSQGYGSGGGGRHPGAGFSGNPGRRPGGRPHQTSGGFSGSGIGNSGGSSYHPSGGSNNQGFGSQSNRPGSRPHQGGFDKRPGFSSGQTIHFQPGGGHHHHGGSSGGQQVQGYSDDTAGVSCAYYKLDATKKAYCADTPQNADPHTGNQVHIVPQYYPERGDCPIVRRNEKDACQAHTRLLIKPCVSDAECTDVKTRCCEDICLKRSVCKTAIHY